MARMFTVLLIDPCMNVLSSAWAATVPASLAAMEVYDVSEHVASQTRDFSVSQETIQSLTIRATDAYS